MRRLVLVPAGLLAGFLAAALVLAGGVLVEAVGAPAGSSLEVVRVASFLAALSERGVDAVGLAAGAVWRALLWTCLAPLCLAAAVAEAAGLRSLRWLAGGTGALAALVPTVLRALDPATAAAPVSALEARMTVLLLLSGVVGGGVFWLFAGQRAARR